MKFEGLKAYYYDSEKIFRDDIIWGLLELGVDVIRPDCVVVLNEYTEEQYQELEKSMGSADFVITQNFSMMVSEACYRKGLRYISWIYDSPQTATYHKEVFYPTNYIFVFDRTQLGRLKELGVKNVYYQPLAANIAKSAILNISNDEITYYTSDVSFVGRLYKRDFYQGFLQSMNPEVRQSYLSLVDSLVFDWNKGKNIFGKIDEKIRHEMLKQLEEPIGYCIDHQYLAEVLMIAITVAREEREKALKSMAQRFQTRLYTDDILEPGELPGVEVRPPVNSDTDMYKVFFSSRINLNLTLRSIETGVPQRVFDIMSVGGFVMSNYQEEMEELFVPDKEIVLFHNMDEMMDKAAYYLSHEKKRVRIAMAGYDKVRREYNYPESLKKMIAIALH